MSITPTPALPPQGGGGANLAFSVLRCDPGVLLVGGAGGPALDKPIGRIVGHWCEGHGLSFAAVDLHGDRMEAQREALIGIARAQRCAIIIGASLGGWVALEALAIAPIAWAAILLAPAIGWNGTIATGTPIPAPPPVLAPPGGVHIIAGALDGVVLPRDGAAAAAAWAKACTVTLRYIPDGDHGVSALHDAASQMALQERLQALKLGWQAGNR